MTAFARRGGALFAEDVAIAELAARIGTPFYCYSAAALRQRYRRLAAATAASGARIAYAVKANGNLAVVSLLASLGAGADVVSEGELRRALKAGVAPARILFSGVGKSRDELAFAIAQGIGQINVESGAEFERLLDLAARARRPVAIAFRVNPDVAAGGHDKISTGRRGDKFGMAFEEASALYDRAARHPFLEPVGLATHIGSQILDLAAFETAFERLGRAAARLRRRDLCVARLDLGGGLGVAYREGERELPLADYGALLARIARDSRAALTIEPGRWLVAAAGVLVTAVNAVKRAGPRRFVIVDAAMNDLLRPALYGARHPVWPVAGREGATLRAATVAGPVCESGDVLAADVPLPDLQPGALLAIGQAGAYGAAMASAYNGRLLVPEAMVSGGRFALVRRRPSHDEAMALERLPDWTAA